MGHALNASTAMTFILEFLDEVIRDGTDMPLRAAGGEHHMIADRCLAAQVDDDNVISLGGIERVENDLEQTIRICAK
jgi:hypothetical protein